MATVEAYDKSNWMAAVASHVGTPMSNVICWSQVWGFGAASTTYTATGLDLLKARVRISPSVGGDVEYAYHDPHPYGQWFKFGVAATTVTADAGAIQPCDKGVARTVGSGGVANPGAMSGSFPVIMDGVCYWVEVGAAGGVPRCVRKVLEDAGIMYS